MEKIWAGKQQARINLAKLSFEEKIAMIERMRDRDAAIASSPLRQKSKLGKAQAQPPSSSWQRADDSVG